MNLKILQGNISRDSTFYQSLRPSHELFTYDCIYYILQKVKEMIFKDIVRIGKEAGLKTFEQVKGGLFSQ